MKTTDLTYMVRVYTPEDAGIDITGEASIAFGRVIGTGSDIRGAVKVARKVQETLREIVGRNDIYVRACIYDDPTNHDAVTCPVHEHEFDPDNDRLADIEDEIASWYHGRKVPEEDRFL